MNKIQFIKLILLLLLLLSCVNNKKSNETLTPSNFSNIQQALKWYKMIAGHAPKHEVIKSKLSEAVVIWPENTDQMKFVKVLLMGKKLGETNYSKIIISDLESMINPMNKKLIVFGKIRYELNDDYLGFYSSGSPEILFQGIPIDEFSGAVPAR